MLQKGMVLCMSVLLVCVGIKVFAQEKSEDRVVSERLIAQIDLSSWIKNSLRVSPDGKRVAYWARVGKTIVGKKWLVVVDGREGGQYDDHLTRAGGRIVFDSPDSLHYPAREGSNIYLGEEKIE